MSKIKLVTAWACCVLCFCTPVPSTETHVASTENAPNYRAATAASQALWLAESDVDSLLQITTPLFTASSPEQKIFKIPTSAQNAEDGSKRAAAHGAARLPSLIDEYQRPNLFKASIIIISLLLALAALDVLAHLADQYIKDSQTRLIMDHSVDGIAASLCMIISFIWYGLIQEFVLQHKYPSGEQFPDASFLILVDRVFMVIASCAALLISGTQIQWEANRWISGPGVVEWVATYFVDKSILFLAFPMVSLFKCAQVLPTMICSTLVNGEKFGFRDYVLTILMCAGVAGFQAFNHEDHSAPKEGTVLGIMLMIVGLVGHSLTAVSEKWIFRRYDRCGHIQMMLVTSFVGGIIGCVACQVTVGFSMFFKFLLQNPEAVGHMVMLGSGCTLGVYFVFYLIDHHGPVAMVIAGLVKQILAVYLSASLYHHEVTTAASACAALTFIAILAKPCLNYVLDSDAEVPLKVGKLRQRLNVTAGIRKRLGHEVKMSATVVVAATRLKAGLIKRRERSTSDEDTRLCEYKMAFDMVDKDGSGSIDKDELRGILHALGHRHTGQEVQAMMNEFITEEDSINFDAFVSLLKTMQLKQREQDFHEAFQVFDKDSSGTISKPELLQVFTSLGEKVSAEEINNMIIEADIDKDGMLNFDEFMRMMRK